MPATNTDESPSTSTASVVITVVTVYVVVWLTVAQFVMPGSRGDIEFWAWIVLGLQLLLALATIALWFWAIVRLMLRTDTQFRGRFDKPVWALLVTFVPLFGPIAFFIYLRLAELGGSPARDGGEAT